jgi:hypothetical protein
VLIVVLRRASLLIHEVLTIGDEAPRVSIARSSTPLERSRSCGLLGGSRQPVCPDAIQPEVFAMQTHAYEQIHSRRRHASVATTEILRAGAITAIAAGFIMAAWQMVVAAIAQNPTAVHGINQTLWTPPEAIWSVVFGVHHFHGSFQFIPVFGGIIGHMGNSLIVGMLGVAVLTAILGRRPNPVAAVVLGAAYGIVVEAILINSIINTQKIQTLYSSTPHWSWWVGHAIFGVTLGLLASVLLRRNNAKPAEASLRAS